MVNECATDDSNLTTVDESSLRVKKRMKTLNSYGYQQRQEGRENGIQEDSLNQTLPREGKKPMKFENIRGNIFHSNHADASFIPVNTQSMQNLGVLHAKNFQEAQKTAMKARIQVNSGSTLTGNHEVFDLVKKLKLEGAKLPQTSGMNAIERSPFVSYVHEKLKYSAESRYFKVKNIVNSVQEIADEKISKAGLRPFLFKIITSLNLADETHVEAVCRDEEIPRYIVSLSQTVIGFTLVYISIYKEEQEHEQKAIEIMLNYLESFYKQIQNGKLAEFESSEEGKLHELRYLLQTRNVYYIAMKQVTTPKKLNARA
jgi:hypothetical protein